MTFDAVVVGVAGIVNDVEFVNDVFDSTTDGFLAIGKKDRKLQTSQK